MTDNASREARRTSVGVRGVLAACVAAAALVAAGCGGGGGQSAQEQWASDVCGAISDWQSSMTSIASDFSGGISQDALSGKVDDAEQATQDLVDSLKSIGAPETQSGEQAKSEVDQFADTVNSSVDSIKTEADSLTGGGVAGFTEGVAKIAAEVNTIVQSAKTTLNNVEQLDPEGELKSAIENDPTCQSVTGSS